MATQMNPLMPAGLLGLDPEEIKQQAMNNAALQAGLAGLMASGPSLTPVSAGQVLGQAGAVGVQAYQQGLQQAQQQAIQRQLQETLTGGTGGMAGGKVDRAALADRYEKIGVALSASNPQQAKFYLDASKDMREKVEKLTGNQANVALELFGTADVSKLSKEQLAQAAQVYEQRKNVNAKMGAPAAPVVTVKYGEGFGTGLAKAQVEDISTSFRSAQGAAETLGTVTSIMPVIDEAFAGTGSTVQTGLARAADALGIAGKSTQETLQNTAALLRGAAKLELDAAAGMRGQGAITENERAILRRASSVDPEKLSKPEIKEVLRILEKSSKGRIGAHNQFLDSFIETQPDASRQLNLYRVKPPVPVRRVQ